jgi:hypothetical protein
MTSFCFRWGTNTQSGEGGKRVKEEILLVKIHNTLAEGKDHYEATRGNWRMSKHRFPYIQYVVGVHHGKIVCVFQPEEWEIIEEGPDKGRKRFAGTKASSEVLKKLQMVEDKVMRKFGSGNAIAYLSLEELDQLDITNCQAVLLKRLYVPMSWKSWRCNW